MLLRRSGGSCQRSELRAYGLYGPPSPPLGILLGSFGVLIQERIAFPAGLIAGLLHLLCLCRQLPFVLGLLC